MCTEITFDYEAQTKDIQKPSFFSDKIVGQVKKKYDDYFEAFLDNVFGHDCRLKKKLFVDQLIGRE